MPKKILKGFHVQTPFNNVLRRLGKKYKTKITPKVQDSIKKIMDKGGGFIQTAGIYDIRPFILNKAKKLRQIIIDNALTVNSKSLYDLLKNSTNIAVIAVTIGSEITNQVNKFVEKERMSDAVILDAFGSEAVETAADYMQSVLERGMALQGYKLTRRFSPGYGDLGIDLQPDILDFINADEIGISVNESNIMTPEKSITAFLGLEK